MAKLLNKKAADRIIDANINRAKEGLRVCEEITRFVLDNQRLTLLLKSVRHKIDGVIRILPSAKDLLSRRNSRKDIGRRIYVNELKRKSICDIFFANLQRVKESIRVLEEFSKLINTKLAVKFKNIRYELYEIERLSAKKISRIL